MHADYFVTWNMRDAIIWRTPNLNEAVSHEHRLKTYPIISPVTEPNDLWVVSKQELLKSRAQEILYDLSILQREGHLHLIDVDSTFFVHILIESAKTEKDIEKLMEQVISEVIPDGMRKFPEEFIDSRYLKEAKEISVPDEPLKLGKFFFGRQELLLEGGLKYEAASIAEAKFIMYSQKPNGYLIKIPEDNVCVKKAIDAYERYIEGIKTELFQAFFARTHDHKLADTLAIRVMEKF